MKAITEALVAVQAALPAIAKNNTAEVPTKNGGKYSYTYADLPDLTVQLLPLLTEHGLAFAACPTVRDDGQFVLAYQLLHVSGESIRGDYPLPLQGGPQAQGSAITYARRYALCAVTGVAPDDDDGQAAQAASQAPAKPATEPEQAPKPPDLAPLEAAIINAQDVGVVKTSEEWQKLRDYAARSEQNLTVAIGRIDQAMTEAGEAE